MAKEIKTASIDLDNIHCSDGWNELSTSLGMSYEEFHKVFLYGEYANITIVVDENLNIIGGKINQ